MIALLTLAALAQDTQGFVRMPELNAQLWRMPLDAEATQWTDDAGLAPHLTWGTRAALGWVDRPLRYVRETGPGAGTVVPLLKDAVELDLGGHVTLWRVRVGAVLPVHLVAIDPAGRPRTGLGDLSVDAKATVLDRDDYPLGLAVTVRSTMPTTTFALPLGARGLGGEVALVADRRFGQVLVAANVGTRLLPRVELENVTLDDQLFVRMGAGWAFRSDAGVSLDLAGHANYAAPLAHPAAVPVEALLGGWWSVREDLTLRGGVGTGLTGAIGAPAVRTLVVADWRPAPRPRDTDDDGLVDPDDACPTDPEDADGFEDADGCPDLDNDADGLADAVDRCPLDPEDADGFADEDGCPDPSALVTVRIVDPEGDPVGARAVVAGLGVEEGVGAYAELELHPGRYTLTGEAEGYLSLAETFEVPPAKTYEVVEVMQPVVPEPEPAPVVTRVRVTRERIEIDEKIYFDTGKATIRPESYGILGEIAQVLQDRPDLRQLRIEGHTDSRGSASFNRDLSDHRAAAVRAWLVERGVDPARLVSVGFGEDKPIDPQENAAAWERNRRVEFMVEVWD